MMNGPQRFAGGREAVSDVPMLVDPDPVDCQDVTSTIVAGLREHKSQLHVMSDDPTNTVQWQRRVRREWYTIAWPEHKRDAPMLTDLFDASPDSPVPLTHLLRAACRSEHC